MTIYAAFFIHGKADVPYFELGSFDSLEQAKAAAIETMRGLRRACRAEIFVADERVAEIAGPAQPSTPQPGPIRSGSTRSRVFGRPRAGPPAAPRPARPPETSGAPSAPASRAPSPT